MTQPDQTTVQSQLSTSPRTTYLCEPINSTFNTARRIIAITFSYDEHGNISYGASIYHRNGSKDTFHKQAIRETSHARYTMAPVRINMSDFDITKYRVYCPSKSYNSFILGDPWVPHTRKNANLPVFEDVVKTIRKAMFTKGVSCRRT